MNKDRYSIVIQWSEEDRAYVVTLPEWGGCHTHGATYEEAARNAREVLEMLIETEEEAGRELPAPHGFMYPGPSGFTYELSHANSFAAGESSKHDHMESHLRRLGAESDAKSKKTIRSKMRRLGHFGGSKTPGRAVTKDGASRFSKQ